MKQSRWYRDKSENNTGLTWNQTNYTGLTWNQTNNTGLTWNQTNNTALTWNRTDTHSIRVFLHSWTEKGTLKNTKIHHKQNILNKTFFCSNWHHSNEGKQVKFCAVRRYDTFNYRAICKKRKAFSIHSLLCKFVLVCSTDSKCLLCCL